MQFFFYFVMPKLLLDIIKLNLRSTPHLLRQIKWRDRFFKFILNTRQNWEGGGKNLFCVWFCSKFSFKIENLIVCLHKKYVSCFGTIHRFRVKSISNLDCWITFDGIISVVLMCQSRYYIYIMCSCKWYLRLVIVWNQFCFNVFQIYFKLFSYSTYTACNQCLKYFFFR